MHFARCVPFASAALAIVLRAYAARAGEPSAGPGTESGGDDASSSRITHEPYFASGAAYYGSQRRVVAGVGGGPGYRLWLGPHWAAHVEGRYIAYLGSAFTAAGGVSYGFHVGSWRPFFGLQLAAYGGDSIRVLSTSSPGTPPPFAWAIQGRIALARFVDESFSASIFALDLGAGADARSTGLALGLTLLEIGARL